MTEQPLIALVEAQMRRVLQRMEETEIEDWKVEWFDRVESFYALLSKHQRTNTDEEEDSPRAKPSDELWKSLRSTN